MVRFCLSCPFGNEQGQCTEGMNCSWFAIFLKFCSGLKLLPFYLYIDNKICVHTTATSSSNHTPAVAGGSVAVTLVTGGSGVTSLSFQDKSDSAPLVAWTVLQFLPHLFCFFFLKNEVCSLYIIPHVIRQKYRKVNQAVPMWRGTEAQELFIARAEGLISNDLVLRSRAVPC